MRKVGSWVHWMKRGIRLAEKSKPSSEMGSILVYVRVYVPQWNNSYLYPNFYPQKDELWRHGLY
jgi:hypothetical protein